MKRMILMLAAAASVASAMPLTAYARDDDKGRGGGERHQSRGRDESRGRGPQSDRGGEHRGRGAPDRGAQEQRGQDRGGERWQAQERRRADDGDRRRYEERRRYDERPRYDDGGRPDYMQGPRPNYRSPPPGAAGRRGYAPDSYRGGVVDDYRRYRLRPPPQGYDWVRMGNGFALVERGSGRIFDRVD